MQQDSLKNCIGPLLLKLCTYDMFLKRELSVLGKILWIQKKTHIHPAYYIFPILLSIFAAVFEGVGMGLLVPLLNGFLTKDFSFIKDIAGLGHLLALVPDTIMGSDKGLFGFLIALFIIVIGLKNLFRYLATLGMSYVGVRSIHHLRKHLFKRYLSFGKLYFDRTTVGKEDVIISQFSKEALRPLLFCDKYVNSFFSLIGYLVVMSLISWKLTIFAVPLFFIMHHAIGKIITRLQVLSRSVAESSAEMGKLTVEILGFVPFVKSFNMEQEEERRYADISDQTTRLVFRATAIHNLISPLQEVITLLAVIILLSGMLYLMVQGEAGSAPSFLVYFYLVLNSASKFGTVSNFRGVLAQSYGVVERVIEVFNDEEKFFVPEGKNKFTGLQKCIKLNDLRFSYNSDSEVLKGISFSIEKNNSVAIVGTTGAGKTTIINLLLRHYDCPPNSILIDGVDIREFTLASLRKHIALVSQESFLMHDTLRRNIAYGLPEQKEEDILRAVEYARLKEYVEQLPNGLDTLIGDRGVKLSGGEKQRVSIARALLKGADILILDEATSSLDSKTERLIQEAIDEAIKDRTAIVIAHRLSTIKDVDKIVVVEKGGCIEEGSLNELLEKKGKFYELWEEQRFF